MPGPCFQSPLIASPASFIVPENEPPFFLTVKVTALPSTAIGSAGNDTLPVPWSGLKKAARGGPPSCSGGSTLSTIRSSMIGLGLRKPSHVPTSVPRPTRRGRGGDRDHGGGQHQRRLHGVSCVIAMGCRSSLDRDRIIRGPRGRVKDGDAGSRTGGPGSIPSRHSRETPRGQDDPGRRYRRGSREE